MTTNYNIRHLTGSDTLKETTDVAHLQALKIDDLLRQTEARLNENLDATPDSYSTELWPIRFWRRKIVPCPATGDHGYPAYPNNGFQVAMGHGECCLGYLNGNNNPGNLYPSKAGYPGSQYLYPWPDTHSRYAEDGTDEFGWLSKICDPNYPDSYYHVSSVGLLHWSVDEEPSIHGHYWTNQMFLGYSLDYRVVSSTSRLQGIGPDHFHLRYRTTQSGEWMYVYNPKRIPSEDLDGMHISFVMVY